MKTGNTLRTAKNSLLCFFMALAGGFLVACGGDGVRFTGGGGTPTPPLSAPPVNVAILSSVEISPSPLVTGFPAYLLDTAVKGVSVSGPTGDGLTGDGGVFEASDGGVFEFSIGGTTLGSVQMSSNQMNSEVTPSDFIGLGVEPDQVITIARIMQALDADGMLANGISISESARANTLDLFSALATQERLANSQPSDPVTVQNYIGTSPLTVSSRDSARNHLVATHQCLFSGGYVGDYRANGDLDDGSIERGTVYYAVEPFADRVRRFGFTVDVGALQSFEGDEVGDVGVLRAGGTETILFAESGVVITTMLDGLDFITPRSVDGTWNRVVNGTVAVSGTHDLAAVAGNPGATRRIVGVETTDATAMTVAGMYVLDHFANDDGVFSGQYYSVNEEGAVSALSLTLTIAAGEWLDSTAAAAAETTLTLIGTRGTTIITMAMGIIRDANIVGANENYGTFFDGSGTPDASLLSGTWCDIGGAVGSTVAPTPQVSTLPLTAITIDWSAVEGATVYNLYRSTVSVGGAYTTITTVPAADGATLSYVDRPSAGEYFYRVEACKSDDDCSDISQGIVVEITWSAVEGATVYNLYRSTVSVGGYTQITTVVAADGVATLTTTDSRPSAVPEYFYHVQACSDTVCSEGPPQEDPAAGGGDGGGGNGAPPVDPAAGGGDGGGGGGGGGGVTDVGACGVGQTYTAGQSCKWKGLDFVVMADGTTSLGTSVISEFLIVNDQLLLQSPTIISGVPITFFYATRSGTGSDTEWTITRLQ